MLITDIENFDRHIHFYDVIVCTEYMLPYTTKFIFAGIMVTPMFTSMREKARAELIKRTPLPGRAGQPEEFAHAVRSVIENPYVNASVVRLDGAFTWGLVH